MKELEQWFREQFAERKVESTSGLGQAITYMQNHWAKRTLFLRQPGAPHLGIAKDTPTNDRL